jgi:NAD(P)-dependent dehydrogenase (short-subunit alcohol dehydrogenase family)
MNDLQINYLGAVKTIQKYLPQLQQSTAPSIVLFSTVAVQKGMPFHASIAGAKGAIEGLTKSLAAEFAPKIRVNAIAPSLTDTPLAEKLLNSETKMASAAERHPLKKIGSVQDLSEAALYLLNATWVSGQILAVDGGMSSIGS